MPICSLITDRKPPGGYNRGYTDRMNEVQWTDGEDAKEREER